MQQLNEKVGYLPDEKPTKGKAFVFALQQFLVMLPATVLAAIIMNSQGLEIYSIPAAVFASGIATLSFLFVTKGKIPLYYGSSFSYIPAVGIITTKFANISSDSVFGAIMIASIISGLMSIGAGLLIKKFGTEKIDQILPGHITGMIAMIIGLSLAGNTLSGILNMPNITETFTNSNGQVVEIVTGQGNVDWLSVLVAIITFVTIAVLTVILKKGFISQIPILIGIGVGVLFSYLLYVPVTIGGNYFQAIGTYITSISSGQIGILDHMPWNTLPAAFENPSIILTAILAIFPIAFATIPESAAHVNQVDLYVNSLAEQMGSEKRYNIKDELDTNLIGDGIGDIVAVICGGPAGTNYGENVSASAVTKNFSSYVFGITGIIAIIVGILLDISGNLNISELLTQPVIQGVSLYLFGAIAVQGIALMIEKQINIFDPKVVAVMAFIGIVGLGVDYIKVTDSFILPGIGVAAFGGILLNIVLNSLSKKFDK
ncbi:uracil-xanthine permease family protein [Haploplasma axanthum]|uniref:Uracil transporter n=1 Tax=Haploplasma axanthum TaxID=29552 RepID=A0A449BF37_HAPAX|nr:solute carrier family 23 protein [Haploplasma axanthum]VEU81042.1 Uracil transporter [Haploplasma axanthum]